MLTNSADLTAIRIAHARHVGRDADAMLPPAVSLADAWGWRREHENALVELAAESFPAALVPTRAWQTAIEKQGVKSPIAERHDLQSDEHESPTWFIQPAVVLALESKVRIGLGIVNHGGLRPVRRRLCVCDCRDDSK